MTAYKIMKEAMLIELKENISDNITLYKSFNNSDLLRKLQMASEEHDLLLEVNDTSNRSMEDLSNAIKLYEYLKGIPLTLASEEKFWAFLTHTSFWGYMCKRWPVQEAEGDVVEFIKTRYFFSAKSKTFYRNGLSRLWWYVHLTYDQNRDDHYYYTRLILGNQDLANLLIETTNLSRNKVALKAILEVIVDIEKLEGSGKINKIKMKRQFIRELVKYINLVGGVTVWDALDEKEAYIKAWNYVEGKIAKVELYS
jgi:hypothetical protein